MTTHPATRSAIVFIVFNRPDVTAQTFETIRRARPSRLYVAADAPRASRPDDPERCEAARRAATAVDWPCEIKTLFHPVNLGAKRAVEAACAWFFEHEEQGIVLEEDMVAVPSFFRYADELLDRYRDDPRVGFIGGLNLFAPQPSFPESYAFSRYFHIWGWASWRRVWTLHDTEMRGWPDAKRADLLARVLGGRAIAARHWTRAFDATWRGENAQWDNKLAFTAFQHKLLGIIPTVSMVTNIGYEMEATTTTGAMPALFRRAIPREMSFPLVHPPVAADAALDIRLEREALGINRRGERKRLVRDLLEPVWPLVRRIRGR